MVNPQVENGYVPIATEIYDALAKIRIPGEARQVLDFIIRKTYGWHKKEDRIPLSQFVAGTGLRKQTICKALKILKDMCLIVTNKGNDVTQYGYEYRTSYCFNKHYDEWKPLPKKGTTIPNMGTLKRKYKNKKQKEEKTLYGEFVLLTASERQKLVDRFGDQGMLDLIERLDLYAAQIGEAKFNAKYKSHYATILNWVRKDELEGRAVPQKKTTPPPTPRRKISDLMIRR